MKVLTVHSITAVFILQNPCIAIRSMSMLNIKTPPAREAAGGLVNVTDDHAISDVINGQGACTLH